MIESRGARRAREEGKAGIWGRMCRDNDGVTILDIITIQALTGFIRQGLRAIAVESLFVSVETLLKKFLMRQGQT